MTKENQKQQPVSGAMTDEQITARMTSAGFKPQYGAWHGGINGFEGQMENARALLSSASSQDAIRNAALEEAVDVLAGEWLGNGEDDLVDLVRKIRALQSAPAQPVERTAQEPVAWMVGREITRNPKTAESEHKMFPEYPIIPLYAAAPQVAQEEGARCDDCKGAGSHVHFESGKREEYLCRSCDGIGWLGEAPQSDAPPNIAAAIKYPDEWDTAAYPTLESALHELAAWHKACRALEAQEDAQQSSAKDAERYRVLRDSKYQLHEDDISVSDSFFNVFFEDELDNAVDELKARYDAIAQEKT